MYRVVRAQLQQKRAKEPTTPSSSTSTFERPEIADCVFFARPFVLPGEDKQEAIGGSGDYESDDDSNDYHVFAAPVEMTGKAVDDILEVSPALVERN